MTVEQIEQRIKDEYRKHGHKDSVVDFAEVAARKIFKSLSQEYGAYKWIEFNISDMSSFPKEYGKYLITRKDGKIHWETWNGSGWAYNLNEIKFYAMISNPVLKITE